MASLKHKRATKTLLFSGITFFERQKWQPVNMYDQEKFYRRYRARKREFARQLRLSPTPTERRLWTYLRARRLCGCKFYRQVAMGPYIADFRCRECRLIVEVDGEIHEKRKEYDRERDLYFYDRDYRVL